MSDQPRADLEIIEWRTEPPTDNMVAPFEVRLNGQTLPVVEPIKVRDISPRGDAALVVTLTVAASSLTVDSRTAVA